MFIYDNEKIVMLHSVTRTIGCNNIALVISVDLHNLYNGWLLGVYNFLNMKGGGGGELKG